MEKEIENELWPAWSFVTHYSVVVCGDGGLVFSLACLCQILTLNLCYECTQDSSNKCWMFIERPNQCHMFVVSVSELPLYLLFAKDMNQNSFKQYHSTVGLKKKIYIYIYTVYIYIYIYIYTHIHTHTHIYTVCIYIHCKTRQVTVTNHLRTLVTLKFKPFKF